MPGVVQGRLRRASDVTAGVTLRQTDAGDEGFLLALFGAVRAGEFAALPEPVRDTLLPVQYQAQKRQYEQAWPDADHCLILLAGAPVGRLWVARTSREIRLLDIALLPAHQGCGIGGGLVRLLVDEGNRQGLPLTLHVSKHNRAGRLYRRLGFRVTDDDGVYEFLRKEPVAA